jgi:hypothetical protein
MEWLKQNWKHVLGYAATAAASAYGGPAVGAALQAVLTKAFGG